MVLEIVLIATALAAVVGVAVLHRYLRRNISLERRSEPLERYPSVTVVRPIKGLDSGALDNLRAALDNGYPGEVETLFVFDDEQEPAVPLARRAIREHEERGGNGRAEIITCGQPRAGHTGKLNAMIMGLERARGELVAFADSDIRPDNEALRVLVETLVSRPGAGAAFTPVVAASRPRTVGDAGYALLMNGMYGPAAAAAASRRGGELPFIMGQFMLLERSTIETIGGLESAEGQLVDDMYLGARIHAAGLRNVVAPHPVPIIQHGSSLGEFLGIYRRWLTFSRTGLPGITFKAIPAALGVAFWVGLTVAGISLWGGYWGAALLALLVPIMVSSSIDDLHRALGGAALPPHLWWAPLGLMMTAPLVYLSVLLRQKIEWRGRIYDLNGESRLAHGRALDAEQQIERPRPQQA